MLSVLLNSITQCAELLRSSKPISHLKILVSNQLCSSGYSQIFRETSAVIMKEAFVILIVIAVFLTMVQAGAGTGTLESRRGEFTTLTSRQFNYLL